MWWMITKFSIAAVTIVGVTELARLSPRWGALLLTLPIVSIIAFTITWHEQQDISVLSRLARETLVLVPLGLPFFIPLAFAESLGLSFWAAFACGLGLASLAIGTWFWIGPRTF